MITKLEKLALEKKAKKDALVKANKSIGGVVWHKGTDSNKSETVKKKVRKLNAAQKQGLAKGQAMMAKALKIQKEGGSTTVTKTVYKKNLKDILKSLK